MSSTNRQGESSETVQFRYGINQGNISVFLIDTPGKAWADIVGYFPPEPGRSDLDSCIDFVIGFRHIKSIAPDKDFPCELYDSNGNLVRKGSVIDPIGKGKILDYVWEDRVA